MFCPACGSQNLSGARFCAECGHALFAAQPDKAPGLTPVYGSTSKPFSEQERRGTFFLSAAAITLLVSALILAVSLILFNGLLSRVIGLADEDMMMPYSNDIEIYIRNTATEVEIADLGARIEEMPEVQDVTYISKDRALEILRQHLKSEDKEDMLDALTGNPLPASYKVVIKNPEQVTEVASRFFDDPVVDNTPGKTDGVRYSDAMSDYGAASMFRAPLILRTTSNIAGSQLFFLLTWGSTILFIIASRRRRKAGLPLAFTPGGSTGDNVTLKDNGTRGWMVTRACVALLVIGSLTNTAIWLVALPATDARDFLLSSFTGSCETLTYGECKLQFSAFLPHGLSILTLMQLSFLVAVASGVVLLVKRITGPTVA